MNRYIEAERDIVRDTHKPQPGHIWTRRITFGRWEIRQSYNFALCEARTRAKVGLDDGMEVAA